MAGIYDYSSVASDNGSVGGVNIAEFCPAGNLNNGLRAIMADLATFLQLPILGGNTSVEGTITVNGAATLGGSVTINGAASTTGDVTIGGNLLLDQPTPILQFNNGGPRIAATSANRLGFYKDGLANERLAIAEGGYVHLYGARDYDVGVDIGGSGNLRVLAAGTGSYAVSTWHDNDYTPFQIVKYSGGTHYQVGSITVTGMTSSFNTTSDERLKTNFRDFDAEVILDAIWVGAFDFTDGGSGHGVRAQQAWTHFPQAITPGGEEEPWGADYSKFVPLLMRSRTAMKARIEAIEARLATLEAAPADRKEVHDA